MTSPPKRFFLSDGPESMRNVDIYTIIFLALAVFIFFRLRSVLGQRTGRERPPYDSVSTRDARPAPVGDKVITLPTRKEPPRSAEADSEPAPAINPWEGIAPAGSPIAAGLDAIAAAEPGFDAKEFLGGARQAYEMIVTAFADGDRRVLKNLLSREVFDGFDAAIREREERGERSETKFVAIDIAEITGAELRGRTAHITVRFVSQLISHTRDKSGAVIDGSPEKVTDVTDIWTFARETGSRDPNWKLVATEAGH